MTNRKDLLKYWAKEHIKCSYCGAEPTFPCHSRKTGNKTEIHGKRIDVVFKIYNFGKRSGIEYSKRTS